MNPDATPADKFTHGGYTISDLGHGLRPFDNCLGFVTSYMAKGQDGLLCVFAFAVNGFNINTHSGKFVPEQFVARAHEIITRKIDDGNLRHTAEYTFEYDLCPDKPKFWEVNEPYWWLRWK
jgi:hypothetical protein